MYCTECGSNLEATHRFCSNCGVKIASNIAELTGSTPDLNVKYSVSYDESSWLSRLTGRAIYSIIWLGGGFGLCFAVFYFAEKYELFVLSSYNKVGISLIISVYCACRWGWIAGKNMFAKVELDEPEHINVENS